MNHWDFKRERAKKREGEGHLTMNSHIGENNLVERVWLN